MSEIRVNNEQWNSISTEEQELIISGFRKTGALRIGQTIVADENKDALQFPHEISFSFPNIELPRIDLPRIDLPQLPNPITEVCKVACDAVAATALAWCSANTAGVGYIACVAAAAAIQEECKRNC